MDNQKRKTQPKATKDKHLALMVEKALEKLTLGSENLADEDKVMTLPSSPRLSRSFGRSKVETLMAQVP